MRSAQDEIALWQALLTFEKKFLADFVIFEQRFDTINDDNATDFCNEAEKIANYVKFFACFQISASFVCKNKVPTDSCFYGIDNLVSRCEDKLTAFLGARLTSGTNTNFDFQIMFAITSKFRSAFDYNLLKNEISKPINQIVMKALKAIPLYQKLLDEDGDFSQLPQSFFSDATKLKSEIEPSPELTNFVSNDQYKALESAVTKLVNNQICNNNNFEKLISTLSNNQNEQNSTFNSGLVKSIKDSNISAHLDRWDLRDERKFDGTNSKLIFFIRHLILKVFPSVSKPEDRMTVIQRNVTDNILDKADTFFQTADNLNIAIYDFLNEVISEYGDRYDIALITISDFLNSISFDSHSKDQLMAFNLEIKNFCHMMWFIGQSSAINNIFFLREFLKTLPEHVRLKWQHHVAKNDVHIRRIFTLKSDNSLCYNVTPEKRESAKVRDSIDEHSTIKCPPEKGSKSHEISFTFKTFVDWFDSFYVKGGMGGNKPRAELNCNAYYSNQTNASKLGESSGFKPKKFNNYSNSHQNHYQNLQSPQSQSSNPRNKKYKRLIVNPNLQHKLQATRSWHDGLCSIQEDRIGKQKESLWRLLFLRHHRGCFRCGFNHFTSKCSKIKIPNFPCDHSSHKNNHEKRFFHNSAFHVDNWERDRNKFLVVEPDKTLSYTTMACHNEFEEYQTQSCPDNENGNFDFYTGEYLDDSHFLDMNTDFSETYDFESDNWLKSNDSDETTANIMMYTSDFDPGFEKSNMFSDIPQSVSSFRTFCNVILSNVDKSFKISTILMFDSGSDFSFIDEFARLQTRIPGRGKKIQLGGINCQNEKFIKMCSCLLINPSNNNTFRLDNIGCLSLGQRDLVPQHTIPSKKIVQATPGLADLDWPSNPECHILLGCDYLPLFFGDRSPMSTPHTLIETTPLGIKLGGLLGNKRMIESRIHQVRSLMSLDVTKASVGACYSNSRMAEFENTYSISNQANFVKFAIPREIPCEDKRKITTDIVDGEIPISSVDKLKESNSVLLQSISPEVSFFEQNSDPSFAFSVPKEVLNEKGDLIPLFDSLQNSTVFSKEYPFNDMESSRQNNVNNSSGNNEMVPKTTKSNSNGKTKAKDMPCHKPRDRTRKRSKINLAANTMNIEPSKTQNIINPSMTHINPAMRDVQIFEMPDWQKTLADNLSEDLLECVVGDSHPRYDDLYFHTYLDEKNWSLEQRYTFEQCVKKAYKDKDGRYVIPMVFNSRIKDLSNSKHLAKHFIASCKKRPKRILNIMKILKNIFRK